MSILNSHIWRLPVRRLNLIALLLVAAVVSACSSNSPSSPSGAVTVNGSIVASGGGNGSTASTAGRTGSTLSVASVAPAGLRVSVAGSNNSVSVDAAGQFSLKNVPPGNPTLRFTATNLDSSLPLTDVQSGQTVTIAVSLDGSTAVLESDRRAAGSEEQLEGKVESLLPAAVPPSLVVAGRSVTTTPTTTFWLNGQASTFAALALGQRVHVKGESSGAALVAREVKIQNTNTSTGLNLNGVISAFTGTPSAFQFTVNGQLVKGDAATEFYGNSQFLELVDGAQVEVKGSQREGFVYATRIHINTESIEFTGTITAETVANQTFTIGGKTVKMTSDTEVRRGGDTQDVSVLYVNQVVEVTGELLADGTVIARKVSIVTDAAGGYFEMEGTMGGKTGTCPTIAFSVAGYNITTTLAATTFDPNSCASFSNGTKVLVKGTVQANLSVLASLVKK
jgi:hypothetical protein